MSSPSSPHAPAAPPTRRVGQALRRYFLTGLATLFPIATTLYLVLVIFNIADRSLGRMLGFQFPGLGLIVTVLIIMAAGVLSTHVVGRIVFPTIEAWFVRLPFIKKIYPAVKQLAKFLFGDQDGRPTFNRVVLVEYPRSGSYSLAFVTNESTTMATGRPTTLLTLLIPTPPSPFTGPIIFVPKEDATLLDLSVEEAITLVVSGGVVAPPLSAAQPS